MISIIVPVYNTGIYLRQCMESLINQTYTDIEVILVNDGSTDDTPAICEEYAARDSRIKVLHKKNGGPVSARKEGLCASKGEYIAFVDGDDWVELGMYGCLLEKLEGEQVDVVMCGRYEDTGSHAKKVCHGIAEGRYDKDRMAREVYPRMLVGGAFFSWGIFPGLWDKLFRRECLYSYLMQVDDTIVMGDDAACVYPCLLGAESIYIMGECLYHYRQSINSVVKRIEQGERKRFQILYQSVERFFTAHRSTCDLREQWKQYLLFLMVPRADGLYQGMDRLDYLFPFPEVKKGFRIILYCAGTYGQRLYQYLCSTGFCRVAAWVDREYQELQKQGLPVESPEVVAERDCDTIVIATMFARAREEIYGDLKRRYPDKIVYGIDGALLGGSGILQRFGLCQGGPA